jgi:riboflavin kinase/FMN adenylyltransferase
MKCFRQLTEVKLGPSACAIGMFYGIHAGHRMVLEQALRVSKIQGLNSVVFTFANHPQSVISQTPTQLLSSLDERLAAFAQMGFDAALVLDFTPDIRDLNADDFVQTILLDTLQVKAVSIGYDHRFGQGRRGDGDFLKRKGATLGFDVDIIEPVRVDQQIVSSTLIRKLLSYGDLAKANQLLGQPYRLSGLVQSGMERGRTIGFPTANIHPKGDRLVPAKGVYAGFAQIGETPQRHAAVCNIGLAPTFGDQTQPRVEVHLLDFEGDLYGQTVAFEFLIRLRDEQTFASVDALIQQVQLDCIQARQYLSSEEPLPSSRPR